VSDVAPTAPEVRRLPLWKDLFEKIVADGLAENKAYPIAYFVAGLECDPNSVTFAFGLHEIRRALRRKGWVLSGRGQNGTQFILLPRSRNADEMLRLQNTACTALREGVILGTNTDMGVLTSEERNRHEAILEKMAKRAALMGRRIPGIKAPGA
jgi:hypothetical protein